MLRLQVSEQGTDHPRPTEAFFLRRRGLRDYAAVQEYIESERKHKATVFKNLAKIAKAYEGGISYADLKAMPSWEVDNVVKALEEVRREEHRLLQKAARANQTPIGFGN